MAGTGSRNTNLRAEGARIAIIEARYYEAINDQLIDGALRCLDRAGCLHDHIIVAGALEIPAAVKLCLDHNSFDGFIAVGCVIRGETTHYELVAGESSRGLMDLATGGGALIGNAILTVENMNQAEARANPADQDKGGHAAAALIGLIDLKRRLKAAG